MLFCEIRPCDGADSHWRQPAHGVFWARDKVSVDSLLDSLEAPRLQVGVVSSTMGKCQWWFDATKDLCELKGLRRRNSSEVNICPTSMKGDRSKCTGNSGAKTPGQVPAAPGLQSFDKEDRVGAWTTAGGDAGKSNERASNGELMCMEDENYNFLDFEDCAAALSSPKVRTPGACPPGVKQCPDDVAVFDICFSCQWMMWYKKKYCHCCNPNMMTDKYENGEECCDGIDMACGLNGHDRRDGTPRGVEAWSKADGSDSEVAGRI